MAVPCESIPSALDLTKNGQLRDQLDSTRSRLIALEEQMGLLTIRMEEERRRAMRVNDCPSPLLSPPSPNPMLNFPLSPFTMATLLPAGASQYLDATGNGGADSASIASLSMTPDPFSPFQRLAPPYSPRPQLISSDNTYSGISLGLHPHTARSCSVAEKVSPPGLGAGKGAIDVGVTKYGRLAADGITFPLLQGRFDRTGKGTSMQDLQVPVELLVAKTLGTRSQDASIALQQQLKHGAPTRKTAIIQAITPHILRLSDDKHGNFLVQRAG